MVDFFAGMIPTAQQLDDTALVGTVVAQFRQTVAQSIPTNVPTGITFDTEDYDLLGGHSTVTNPSRYTCQREGWYQMLGGVGFANVAGGAYRASAWGKNGSPLDGTQQLAAPVVGAQTLVAARPFVVYLVVGDYVELLGQQNQGGAVNTFVLGAGQSNMQLMYAGLPT